MDSIVTLIGRAGGALPKDLKENEASHKAEAYPHTSGPKGDSISDYLVSLPTTIYIASLCTKEWC